MSPVRDRGGRIFWGIILVIVGILFLLEQMHQADASYILGHYWPVILIVIGLWIIVTSEFRNSLGGIILVAMGGIFLLINLGIFREDVWSYAWPLAIVVVGVWILIRPRARTSDGGKFPELKGDDIDAANVFSGQKRTVTTPKFRGGKASVVFGGMELDFTQAGLNEGQATLELTAIFGGIDVWVPKEWKVVVDATPILGGVDDKHRVVPEAEIKGTLYIKAVAIFGGIDIKN